MIPYVFLAASIIAVFGILFAYKIAIDKIKNNPEDVQQAQSTFFIWVAVVEIIPIILIIYGLNDMRSTVSSSAIYVSAAIIILLVAFAALFIYLQNRAGINETNTVAVKIMSQLSLGIIVAIPIISLVGLFTML